MKGHDSASDLQLQLASASRFCGVFDYRGLNPSQLKIPRNCPMSHGRRHKNWETFNLLISTRSKWEQICLSMAEKDVYLNVSATD
jgi:hypothetical protein